MFLSPLQNQAVSFPKYDDKGNLVGEFWRQSREKISQEFGNKLIIDGKDIYGGFGMKGHNGVDFATKVGTKLFSPCDGIGIVRKSTDGYGWHIRIRNQWNAVEFHLAHLSEFAPRIADETGEFYVSAGEYLGKTGGAAGHPGSGSSTGPHFHLGFRKLIQGDSNRIFQWKVENYNNGFYGHIDPSEFLITWKGSISKNTI